MSSKNTSVNSRSLNQNETLYLLDPSKLLPGDILLSTVINDFGSKTIRQMTGSDYSHAALCINSYTFIEAVTAGVRTITSIAFATTNKSYGMRLLRLKNNLQDIDSEKVQEIITQIAEEALYKPYNLKGALHSVLAPLFNISGKDKEFFCSELVASVYKKAGIELLTDRLPEGTPPNFLLESIYLEDITDEVLIIFQGSNLKQLGLYVKEDGDDMKRFSEIELDIYHNILEEINEFCRANNLSECKTFEDVLIVLNNLSSTNHNIFKELDNLFADQLETSNYGDLMTNLIQERHLNNFIEFFNQAISSCFTNLSRLK